LIKRGVRWSKGKGQLRGKESQGIKVKNGRNFSRVGRRSEPGAVITAKLQGGG